MMAKSINMTKAELIALYGEAWYAEQLAKQKAKLKAEYASLTPEERTARYQAKKAYLAEWRASNADKLRAYNRKKMRAAYQAMSPEQRSEMRAKQVAARRAKLAIDREFAEAQRLKGRERVRRWDAAHPGVNRRRNATWEKAHPEVKRANKHARRALGKPSPAFIAFLRSQPCLDCGKAGTSTIGHLIPVSRGGTNHPCNLIAQCRSCNSRQHARIHPRAMFAHYPQAATLAAAA